tara:strand:+ start:3411 stop:3641 length:231 start_codon:yes stop_codon:yes gene_type:complete
MYIVCTTTTKDDYEFHDSYSVFENLKDAREWYNHLLTMPETHTASLCKPVDSTEPHYLVNKLYSNSVKKLKKGIKK